jgi:hypothetical protein
MRSIPPWPLPRMTGNSFCGRSPRSWRERIIPSGDWRLPEHLLGVEVGSVLIRSDVACAWQCGPSPKVGSPQNLILPPLSTLCDRPSALARPPRMTGCRFRGAYIYRGGPLGETGGCRASRRFLEGPPNSRPFLNFSGLISLS